MDRVKDLLDSKGHHVCMIKCQGTVLEAAQKMLTNRVGSLLVLREGTLEGIFTWHDLVRAIVDHPNQLDSLQVIDYTTRDLVTTTENEPLEKVEEMMISQGIHHLPVLRGADVVGVMDLADVLKRCVTGSRTLTQDLEAYILNAYPR